MADIFRIQDTFHITGRGPVYMLMHPKDTIIRVDDLFYDLHGNRFRVKGIEMIRRTILDADHWDKLPVGVMFEWKSLVLTTFENIAKPWWDIRQKGYINEWEFLNL